VTAFDVSDSVFAEKTVILASDELLVFRAEFCDPFGDSPGGFQRKATTGNAGGKKRAMLMDR
jgi:hypothetical protein